MLKTTDGKFFEYEMIGEFRTKSNWIHQERVITSYEMIFVLEGKVYMFEDEEQYEVGANEVIILEPGKRHGGYKVSTEPTAFYWFHFNTDMEILQKIYRDKEYYDLKYLLKKLLHVTNADTYPPETADSLGLLIFNEYLHIAGTSAALNNSLLKNIDEFIRLNAGKNISAEQIAARFGYNTDYLGRLFKKNHGIGLKKYIASVRIKAAKDLLLTTNLSVKEIASKIDFADENLFVKFFIYHEEISPSRFRNKYACTHMNDK